MQNHAALAKNIPIQGRKIKVDDSLKTAVIFDNFGPYHWERLHAAAEVSDLLAIEIAGRSAEYAWDNEQRKTDFRRLTLFGEGTSREASSRELVSKLERALEGFSPAVVFIPGWSSRAAFAALRWCVKNQVPVVAMSESTAWDEKRKPWKEWLKRQIVKLCSTALAGGTPHQDYLIQLGMPAERIFLGYDAVDNNYFSIKAEESRKQEAAGRKQFGLPQNYFLASNRFIEKKNLPRLLEAYASYRQRAENGERKTEIWNLVLLGDGPLRETLNSQLSTLNLHTHMLLPGFQQYPALPAYYGLARAFVHASTSEQWGLVVNEAMASGLPVLVSNRCGCARDLVREGVNGFTFDPYHVEQLAKQMLKLSTLSSSRLSTMGAESQRLIANWGPGRFASGLKAAAEFAQHVGPVKPNSLQQIILKTLLAH
jgi:glycosyltransferase involved in cell wall biosynthesis